MKNTLLQARLQEIGFKPGELHAKLQEQTVKANQKQTFQPTGKPVEQVRDEFPPISPEAEKRLTTSPSPTKSGLFSITKHQEVRDGDKIELTIPRSSRSSKSAKNGIRLIEIGGSETDKYLEIGKHTLVVKDVAGVFWLIDENCGYGKHLATIAHFQNHPPKGVGKVKIKKLSNHANK